MASAGIFPTQLKSKPRPPARLLLPHFENEQNQMHISIIEITLASTYAVCVCECLRFYCFTEKSIGKAGVALDTRIRIIRRIISVSHCHVHYLFI